MSDDQRAAYQRSGEAGMRYRRCSFDHCKKPATAQGHWTAIDVTGWYCRMHLNMLRRVSGVREVVR